MTPEEIEADSMFEDRYDGQIPLDVADEDIFPVVDFEEPPEEEEIIEGIPLDNES